VFPRIGGKPPKWMVKIMENPMKKWYDLGEKKTLFFGNPHIYSLSRGFIFLPGCPSNAGCLFI